jgi:putative endonuclease
MYFVYFAKSISNKKIYTGYTSKEPQIRVAEHNQNSNTFTSQNGPFKLIYFEKYLCKQDAKNRENFYKSGFGKQIQQVIVKYIEANLT